MISSRRFVILAFGTALAAAAAEKPLVIASQGSFFVGGETKTSTTLNGAPTPKGAAPVSGDVTINQMYVQYQTPVEADRHLPVVMVHGCCLSSKTWETTPDGRMGWNEYFVRKGYSVYLADQSSRARSGFDATTINAVKAGLEPPSKLPNIFMASHQTAWTLFRFGPEFNKAFADEQFPVKAADELYKQMIPDLNGTLPMPNPTWKNMAVLAEQLHGAVLMGHSESGFYPEQAALIDPKGIRGIISIEMGCSTDFKAAQLATLAKIPILIIFGDHLGDVPGRFAKTWPDNFDSCQKFVGQVKKAGGDAEMMSLPKIGIHGNSHMLMQDKNNLQIADLIVGWMGQHVERKESARR